MLLFSGSYFVLPVFFENYEDVMTLHANKVTISLHF